MDAWPALKTLFCDGWVLRFAEGYTRRANSIHPLYAPQGDVETNIRMCEAVYAAQGLPSMFKMTPASQPAELDALLAARGYVLDAPTSVQVLDLAGEAPAPARSAELSPELTEAWFSAYCGMSAVAEGSVTVLRRILQAIVPPRCFAVLYDGDVPAACGLAVLEYGYLGFFEIVTAQPYRRQGYGTQLMLNLLAWGMQNRAATAYLQVMQNNPPALQLYAGLGFRELYPYWYRVHDGAR